MDRILEPEYMDTAEEAEGYDNMDHTLREARRVLVAAAAGIENANVEMNFDRHDTIECPRP